MRYKTIYECMDGARFDRYEDAADHEMNHVVRKHENVMNVNIVREGVIRRILKNYSLDEESFLSSIKDKIIQKLLRTEDDDKGEPIRINNQIDTGPWHHDFLLEFLPVQETRNHGNVIYTVKFGGKIKCEHENKRKIDR